MKTTKIMSVRKCGGELLTRAQLRNPEWNAGDVIPCPVCGKSVKLRRSFNGHQRWVQIPVHNSAKTTP